MRRQVLTLAILTLLLIIRTSEAQTLGPDGIYYEYFNFIGATHTWAGAYAEAQTRTFDDSGTIVSGYLAPVATSTVASFLNTLVNNGAGQWAIVWNGDYVNNGVVYAGAQGAVSDTSWINWASGSSPSITVGQTGNYGVTMTGSGYGYNWQVRSPSFSGIGGYIVAFAPQDVPEPSIMALAGLGGLGLLLFRRCRNLC